jgi:hypothetical protein
LPFLPFPARGDFIATVAAFAKYIIPYILLTLEGATMARFVLLGLVIVGCHPSPGAFLESGGDRLLAAEAQGQTAPAAIPRQLELKFSEIQPEIDRLEREGHAVEAQRMSQSLDQFRRQFTQPFRPLDPQKAELHVIGVYEGQLPGGQPRQHRQHPQGLVEVSVDYTGAPIILALCAYEPVKWRIAVADGTTVREVIVTGYYAQEVAGLDAKVPVRDLSRPGGRGPHFYAYRRDDESYRNAARTLGELTGLGVATFQGIYGYRGQPFIVGPANQDWVAQNVEFHVELLHRDATRHARAVARDQMRSVRFEAMLRVGIGRHAHASSYGRFTPSGPIQGSLTKLPPNVNHIAVDPKEKKAYVIQGHEVGSLNLGDERITTLEIDKGLEELSWPCGLAFDSKRRRLILTSLGGEGHIYCFDVDKGKWSSLGSMNNIDLLGLCYSPEEDLFYGIHRPHSEGKQRLSLLVLDDKGVIVGNQATDVEAIGRPGPGGVPVQAAAVGKQVALLVAAPDDEPPEVEQPSLGTGYLVNPRTGKVIYSSRLELQPDKLEINAAEISKLWEDLQTNNSDTAEMLMWRLAGGGDSTVEFFRRHFMPIEKPDFKQIGTLIEQLDHDDFKIRDRASKELSKIGATAEDALVRASKSTSAEVRNRARLLLADIKNDQSSDPSIRRELRAVVVLARIGNPQAIEYLEELARSDEPSLRRRQARVALERLK